MKILLISTGTANTSYLRQIISKKWNTEEVEIMDYGTFGELDNLKFLRYLRSFSSDISVLGTSDIFIEQRLRLWKILVLLTRSKQKLLFDENGFSQSISWLQFIMLDIPHIALEFLLMPLILIKHWLKIRYEDLGILKAKKYSRKSEGISNILYLRTDLPSKRIGGLVGHTVGLISGFLEHGVNIVHVSSYQFPGTSEIRIPIHIFNPWRFLNTFSEISRLAYNSRFVRNTLKIAAKTKPDIIYQRYNILNYSGVTLARHLKIPFILEIHSFATWTRQHWSRTKGRFLRSIHNVEMLNLKAADLLIVVSEPLRKDLINLGIDEKKILVNPIGVDPQKFNPEVEAELRTQGLKRQLKIGSDKVIVGFAGSFGPWHGIPELTEAIYEILSKHLCSNACFLLIGDGQYRADTEKKLRNYENVIFTGQVPYTEIQYYLAFCNILVVPNNPPMHGKEFFGSPTKMFEYMAMGKAIVASNLGQIGLVLENSKTAILVEPGNIRELINGILMLVKDGNLRENLGKNARKKVIAEHTWKENTKRVMEAVQRL